MSSGSVTFLDESDVSPYAKGTMAWAIDAGLLETDNGKVRPTAAATRSEVAFTLAACLERLSLESKTLSGENGKSAYELAVENGFDGSVSEWLAS